MGHAMFLLSDLKSCVTKQNRFLGRPLLKVNPMKVIVAERSVTLGAFSLPRVVSGLQTLKTEHVKAFRQNGVFLTGITTRTRQLCLKNNKKKIKKRSRDIWTSSISRI